MSNFRVGQLVKFNIEYDISIPRLLGLSEDDESWMRWVMPVVKIQSQHTYDVELPSGKTLTASVCYLEPVKLDNFTNTDVVRVPAEEMNKMERDILDSLGFISVSELASAYKTLLNSYNTLVNK